MARPKHYLISKTSIKSPIVLRYLYKGNRLKFYPGISVYVSEWMEGSGRVRISARNAQTINALLSRIESEAERLVLQSMIEGQLIDPIRLRKTLSIFIGKTEKVESIRLCEFVASHIKAREGSPNYSENTLGKYRYHLGKLRSFDPLIDIRDISTDWIERFIQWLSSSGLSHNSISKEIAVLKVFLGIAAENKLIDPAVYRSKRVVVSEIAKEKRYLNLDELGKIKSVALSDQMDNSRRLFLLLAFTGQRYGDLSRVINGQIITVNGKAFMKLIQGKTGSIVHVPVHHIVESILHDPPTVISNQKMNENLKFICEAAGISNPEQVSTHTARRSAATNMYLSGISAKLICSVTGHRTERMLLRYIQADSLDSAIAVGQRWQ